MDFKEWDVVIFGLNAEAIIHRLETTSYPILRLKAWRSNSRVAWFVGHGSIPPGIVKPHPDPGEALADFFGCYVLGETSDLRKD